MVKIKNFKWLKWRFSGGGGEKIYNYYMLVTGVPLEIIMNII